MSAVTPAPDEGSKPAIVSTMGGFSAMAQNAHPVGTGFIVRSPVAYMTQAEKNISEIQGNPARKRLYIYDLGGFLCKRLKTNTMKIIPGLQVARYLLDST
jgi:hypothetical protein